MIFFLCGQYCNVAMYTFFVRISHFFFHREKQEREKERERERERDLIINIIEKL